ncbi:hypothetical protein C8J55DRAFT_489544 [Lentinula edodes]|uniref:DUF6532 domain-containing protein n=1 Tax=Lentinula lateritia TaxID=40482 RepID=A0A9W9DNC1_9AGAR|nr:hypothetical protein C8J55DRAFT_489544 [Lentinula edodes]
MSSHKGRVSQADLPQNYAPANSDPTRTPGQGNSVTPVTRPQTRARTQKATPMSLQKKDSQPRQRVDPPRSAIKHGPVYIDINADDTGVESAEEAPPRKKAKIAPVTLHHGSQYQQEDDDESESSSGNDSNDPALGSDASMDNPQDDLGAGQHLAEEGAVFTNGTEEEGNTERSHSNASYDDDSIFFEERQLSDMEIDGEPELMEPTPSRRSLSHTHGNSGKQWLVIPRAMASRRSQKLESELPRVSEMVLPTSQAVQGPRTATSTSVSDSKSEPKWKERTKINTISHNRTFTLGPLSGQRAVMLSVIEKAITLGKRNILLDTTFSPVGSASLKQIGYAALVRVATDEGFDGEYDVCDRLEHGENNAYAKPLISYVSHRIGTERSQLKDHFSVVLGAFNLSHASGTAPAINLVQRRTYFYPQTPSISDERYKYDYSRPFEHPVFAGYMGAAFFSSTYYSGIIKRYSDVFVSSIQEKPNELEVPKALVALASTAIHACIQDFSSGIKDNFPTKELDGVWKLSLEILDGIQKRNHMKYHRLMHNLYIESSGAVSSMHSMTNQQVYDTIDWSAIEQDDDDYNGNGNHDGNPPAQASNKVNKQPVTAADATNEGSRIDSTL